MITFRGEPFQGWTDHDRNPHQAKVSAISSLVGYRVCGRLLDGGEVCAARVAHPGGCDAALPATARTVQLRV